VNGIPAHFSSQHMRLYKTNEGFIQPQSVYNQSSPSNANLKKRPQFERVEKPAPKKRRHGLKSRNLPKDKSVVLKKWLSENTNHPYPTEQEKEYFSKTLSMTLSQVSFISFCLSFPNFSIFSSLLYSIIKILIID